MRERLIELLLKLPMGKSESEVTADYLLENGVVVPPCKVGSNVYMIVTKRPKICMPEYCFIKKTYITEANFFRVCRDFGKTVFTTREAAENALKKEREKT